MDQLRNNLPTSERFTAEQVRKFLGLNDYYSNSSSSLSSDCENDNLSDISSDINTNQSESDQEDIILPSLKRGKRTENKSVQKIDGISRNQAGKHTTGGTSNPLDEKTVSLQYQTSGSTQSLTSHNILAVQQNQHQHVEIETPTTPNHVEHNFESVILDNPVPEPVFTIDLGIQILPGSPLQNENHVQIIHTPVHEISENVRVPVPLENNTKDSTGTSIQNGITLPTNTLPPSDSHNQQIQLTHPPNSFQDTLSSDVEDTNDYYEVQTELPNTDTNVQFTPIVNYPRDEILE